MISCIDSIIERLRQVEDNRGKVAGKVRADGKVQVVFTSRIQTGYRWSAVEIH